MNITIVHDDTDSVKLWIKELRQSLRHVKPHVTFDSCCMWTFEDTIFDKKQAVLVLLSKYSWQFSEEVYKSRMKYNESKVKRRSQLCVVLETNNTQIEKKFRDLIGKDHISVVGDLMDSFKWLPKVCAFIFKRRHRKRTPTCSVPKVVEDSKMASLRQNLIKGLESIDINVVQDLDCSPDCFILMRKRTTDSLEAIVNSIRGNKRLIFEFVVHFSDEQKLDLGNRMYGTNNQVVFIIHILYILGLINVNAPHNKVPVSSDTNMERDKCTCRMLTKYCCYVIVLVPCTILFIIILILLLLGNPGLPLFFLTPLPYIAFIHYKLTSNSNLWEQFLATWLVLCPLAVIGGIGYIVYGFSGFMEQWCIRFIIFPFFIILSISSTTLQLRAMTEWMTLDDICTRS